KIGRKLFARRRAAGDINALGARRAFGATDESARPRQRAPGPELFLEHSLIAPVKTQAEVGFAPEVELQLAIVIPALRSALPIKIAAERVGDRPRDQSAFRLRLGVVADREPFVVGVGAEREAEVGPVVAGAPLPVQAVVEVPPGSG